MGFFDTLLTAIAPERAVKRVAAQTAIRAINSGYSNYGASLHKKSMRGWMWHGGSPKEDIEDNLRVSGIGLLLLSLCISDFRNAQWMKFFLLN